MFFSFLLSVSWTFTQWWRNLEWHLTWMDIFTTTELHVNLKCKDISFWHFLFQESYKRHKGLSHITSIYVILRWHIFSNEMIPLTFQCKISNNSAWQKACIYFKGSYRKFWPLYASTIIQLLRTHTVSCPASPWYFLEFVCLLNVKYFFQ